MLDKVAVKLSSMIQHFEQNLLKVSYLNKCENTENSGKNSGFLFGKKSSYDKNKMLFGLHR